MFDWKCKVLVITFLVGLGFLAVAIYPTFTVVSSKTVEKKLATQTLHLDSNHLESITADYSYLCSYTSSPYGDGGKIVPFIHMKLSDNVTFTTLYTVGIETHSFKNSTGFLYAFPADSVQTFKFYSDTPKTVLVTIYRLENVVEKGQLNPLFLLLAVTCMITPVAITSLIVKPEVEAKQNV